MPRDLVVPMFIGLEPHPWDMGTHSRDFWNLFHKWCETRGCPRKGLGWKWLQLLYKAEIRESVGRAAVCHSGCVILQISR